MSWKHHPLAVPILTFAGTMTFCFTIIMPIWDRIKDNEIATLREEPKQLKARLDGITRQLDQVEAENQKLRVDLDKLRPGDLFSLDDYYPLGFREVRIGDRIDLVSKVYASDAAIKDENGWIAVSLNKPQLFRELVYYYDDSAAVKTVTSMLFHLNANSFSTIREQLLQKYGAKAVHEDRKHGSPTLTWSDGKKTNFELSEATLQINPKY
jgi:hypothetical protein